MYVTITATAPVGTAHGPHPAGDPAPTTDPPTARVTARLCPSPTIDRTTGVITDPYIVADVPTGLIATLLAARSTVPNGGDDEPVVAIVFHPTSRRGVAIGPISGAQAYQWWTSPHNALPERGIRVAVLPLAPSPAGPVLEGVSSL